MGKSDKNEETRTILVEYQSGRRQKISFPADAKVTFSAVNPAAPGHYGNGHCIRIYTSRDNQLAVLTGVAAFRDTSLGVYEQARKVKVNQQTTEDQFGRHEMAEYNEMSDWEPVEV